MCGIIGIVGREEVSDRLLAGLVGQAQPLRDNRSGILREQQSGADEGAFHSLPLSFISAGNRTMRLLPVKIRRLPRSSTLNPFDVSVPSGP